VLNVKMPIVLPPAGVVLFFALAPVFGLFLLMLVTGVANGNAPDIPTLHEVGRFILESFVD